jgi:hypothetical protein
VRTRFLLRSRLRPGPGVGRGGDHPPRPRLRPSPGVGRGGDHLLRPRPGPSPGVEVEAEPWGRARRRPSSEAEVEAEPWGRTRRRPPSEAEAQGRARRSFLLRLRLDLAVVSLTLAGGTTVEAGQTALFSCQVGLREGRSDCGHFGPAD